MMGQFNSLEAKIFSARNSFSDYGYSKPMPNSFWLRVMARSAAGRSASSEGTYSFNNLSISSNDSRGKSWETAENPAYMLLLDGHFYLESSTTVEPKVNLNKLLHAISMTTLEKGLQKIAGGIFSLVILDKQHQKLHVCGDKLGAMPLYFNMKNGELNISSNQFNFNHLPMHDFAAVEFLKYGYLPFSPSFFEGVERLLPGQRLTMDLRTKELNKSAPTVFEFKPLQHRVKDLHEAGEMLHKAFAKYFGRMRDATYALSPLGVGDSSLALVWMRFKEPHLFRLPVTSTDRIDETLPIHIADHYDFPITKTTFREKNLLRQTDRLPELYRIAGSLEFTKVLASYKAVRTLKPDFYIDAFMSDAVFQLHPSDPVHESQRGGFAPDTHNSVIRSINYYQSQLYNSPYAIANEDMGKVLSKEYEVWFLNAARGILEVNRLAGQVHEDFIESLNNYTLHRCLRTMLPISLAPEVPSLAPFADYDVMQTFYDIDRSIRQDHNFYAHYWKTYFPEIADIHQKTNGKGIAPNEQPNLGRRVKSALKKVARRSQDGIVSSEDSMAFLAEQKFLKRSIDHASGQLPNSIPEEMGKLLHKNKLTERLGLRYITLNTYLKRSEKDNDRQ